MTNIQILILLLVVILVIIYFTKNKEHLTVVKKEVGKGPCTTSCSNLNLTAPKFKSNCAFFSGKYEKCKTTKRDIAKTGRKCVGYYEDKCSNLR